MKNVALGERVRLFNTISIESSALCNRTCVFCPNHEHAREDKLMDWALVEKITTELGELDFRGNVNTFMYNEPMKDPRFHDLAALIKRRAPRCTMTLSTNGDYFRDAEDVERVFQSGVNLLHVNIYSEKDLDLDPEKRDRGMRVAQRRMDQISGWVDALVERGAVERTRKVYGTAPRGTRRVFVEPKFGAEVGDGRIGQKFMLSNRAGNIPWFKPPLAEPLKNMCVSPFRYANVNWKGDLLICCDDYYGKHGVGNVRDHKLVELWNSEDMNRLRLQLQNKHREHPLCSKCDYHGGHYRHMVDKVTFGAEMDDAILSGAA